MMCPNGHEVPACATCQADEGAAQCFWGDDVAAGQYRVLAIPSHPVMPLCKLHAQCDVEEVVA